MNQPNLAKTERILHLCKQAPINKWSFWAYLQSRFFSCSFFFFFFFRCIMHVNWIAEHQLLKMRVCQRNQAAVVRQRTASLWLLLYGKSDCNSLITCVCFHTRECHRTVILSFCLYNTLTIIHAFLFWHFTAESKKYRNHKLAVWIEYDEIKRLWFVK